MYQAHLLKGLSTPAHHQNITFLGEYTGQYCMFKNNLTCQQLSFE